LKSTAFVVGLALLTGCPSTPKKVPDRITPLVGEKPVPVEPEVVPIPPATNAPVVAPPPVTPAPVLASRPSVPSVPLDALNRWVFWDSWSATNGFGKPQRVARATNLIYELRNTNGVLAITIGSSVARWNGVNLELAYAPQFTNNRPVIHALDAAKNIRPLVDSSGGLPHPKGRSIVIDPGHGGKNTGTQNINNGGYEKNYALDWALRLRPLLESAGWQVHLTRTNDVEMASSNRVAFADQINPSLFLSLHFNSVTHAQNDRGEHGGVETYCLTPAGMPSTLIREFEDNRLRAYPNNAWDEENLQYAVRLHKALLQSTARRDRGVRRARFMTVLQGQNRPAVLIEGGYLSDPREARLISTASYRQKLAEAVAKALNE
jgi:N-acetylmuramoyl-L-alanine amidase